MHAQKKSESVKIRWRISKDKNNEKPNALEAWLDMNPYNPPR